MAEVAGKQAAWSVDAYLARVEAGRSAVTAAHAAAEAEQSARLHALMPASAALRAMLEDLERRTRAVGAQRRHEVAARLRQPSPECIRVSLRWGRKFELTEADRHLIRSYQTNRRRRVLRYPEVVVAHEFHEIAGVLHAGDGRLRLDPGPEVAIDDLVVRPQEVRSALAAGLASPRLHRLHLRRDDGYRSPPDQRLATSGECRTP
ncbi:MAG: hypothetical protein KY450_04200 [Actinobacteria bacterium]|nr:hypothetical protein [Actinomycetota bacterium]